MDIASAPIGAHTIMTTYQAAPVVMPRRFEALDGLRGLAALGVLLYHGLYWSSFPPFQHGYLAVDFFFGLSGFVIAAAYEKRWRSGLGIVAFFGRHRFVRLYPLLAFSTLLGFAGACLGLAGSNPSTSLDLVRQIFLLPRYSTVGNAAPYPLDNVQWSIFYELIANAAHILFFRRMRARSLLVVWAGAALVLLWLIHRYDTYDGGSNVHLWRIGLGRVILSYTAGVILWRTYVAGRLPTIPGGWIAGAVVLMACLALPHSFIRHHWQDEAIVLFVFPVVIAASVGQIRSRLVGRTCSVLGDLSYPVYLLQVPLFWLLGAAFRHTAAPQPFTASATFGAIILASWLAFVFYDQPVRRALDRLLKTRVSHAGTTAP